MKFLLLGKDLVGVCPYPPGFSEGPRPPTKGPGAKRSPATNETIVRRRLGDHWCYNLNNTIQSRNEESSGRRLESPRMARSEYRMAGLARAEADVEYRTQEAEYRRSESRPFG